MAQPALLPAEVHMTQEQIMQGEAELARAQAMPLPDDDDDDL